MQANLRREVDELDVHINNAGHASSGNAATSGPTATSSPNAPAKSLVKLRAEKLEKAKALRIAQQVSAGIISSAHVLLAASCKRRA